MTATDLRRWEMIALAAFALIVAVIPISLIGDLGGDRDRLEMQEVGAIFVGRDSCIECHPGAYDLWLGSDHDLAMDVANDTTVLGDFSGVEHASGGLVSSFYRRDDGFFSLPRVLTERSASSKSPTPSVTILCSSTWCRFRADGCRR
jgi:hypothetical protein